MKLTGNAIQDADVVARKFVSCEKCLHLGLGVSVLGCLKDPKSFVAAPFLRQNFEVRYRNHMNFVGWLHHVGSSTGITHK